MAILELQNLKKYFATQKAVDDISLSVDGGANFLVTVATGLSGSTQSFVFTPSSTLGKSKTSRIRVIARDQAGNAGVDTSDGNFKLK